MVTTSVTPYHPLARTLHWVLALLKLGGRWPWVRPLLAERGLL